MRRSKFLIFILIIIILLSAGLFYLNKFVLPSQINKILIQAGRDYLNKNISIKKIDFSIFKGFILKDLTVYDDASELINIKEANFNFLILPFLKKKIVIPALDIDSAKLYLKRESTGSFNFQNLFNLKPKEKSAGGFNLIIQSINLKNAQINFLDDYIRPSLEYKFNVNLNINLSLPAEVGFRLKAKVERSSTSLDLYGKYFLFNKELSAKLKISNLNPETVVKYFPQFVFQINKGKISQIQADINLKDNILNSLIYFKLEKFNLSKENFYLNNLSINGFSKIRFNFSLKELIFSGELNLEDLAFGGLDFIKEVRDLRGKLIFDSNGIYAHNLRADLFILSKDRPIKVPLEQIKLTINDFKKLLLTIEINSPLELDLLSPLLRENFNLTMDLRGKANLSLLLQARGTLNRISEVNGSLDILRLDLNLLPQNLLFKDITGRIKFDKEKIVWHKLKFKLLEREYISSGLFYHFRFPYVEFDLSSRDLALESKFKIENKLLHFTRLRGKYKTSEFSLSAGEINLEDLNLLNARVKVNANFDLEVLKEIFNNRFINKMAPQGKLDLNIELKGPFRKIKDCHIKIQALSPQVSLFGLKLNSLSFDYFQSEEMAYIRNLKGSFYEGDLLAEVNLDLKEPFGFNVELLLGELKLEKLKQDTPFSQKDLTGKVNLKLTLGGWLKKTESLFGRGSLSIKEANLWEINLFKGLGQLLFPEDFFKIIFNEAEASFIIKDKAIFSKDLSLKSKFIEIRGDAKLGFDGSIASVLNFRFLGNYLPLTGTLKDLFTYILAEAEKVLIVEISGNLREPKYKIRPAFLDIFEGIKSLFFKESQ